jgi:hypothetical protein
MAELVTIPISTFEITVDYEIPSIHLWADRVQAIPVVEALFGAFAPWGITLDDMELVEQGKNSEKGLRYRLPRKKASFFFGPAFCKFIQDAADWRMAEESMAIVQAGVSTIIAIAKVNKGKQRTSLSLHLQPKIGKFIHILRPFVPPQLENLDPSPVLTLASVVKWGNRSVYIDGSGSIANAVFLKLERDFSAEQDFRTIAEQIHEDERTLFNILGIEEDLS